LPVSFPFNANNLVAIAAALVYNLPSNKTRYLTRYLTQ